MHKSTIYNYILCKLQNAAYSPLLGRSICKASNGMRPNMEKNSVCTVCGNLIKTEKVYVRVDNWSEFTLCKIIG